MSIYSKIKAYLASIIYCVFIGLAISVALNAEAMKYQPLLTDITQIQGLGDLDPRIIDTSYYDSSEQSFSLSTSFTINLNQPVNLDADNGLILYLCRKAVDGSPTIVRIEGKSATDAEYSVLGYAQFYLREINGTHEFSAPLYSSEPRSVSSLRLTVLRVAQKTAGPISTYRLDKINLYQYRKGNPYPNGRIDPLRDETDYYYIFRDFTYMPNNGILSPRNHYEPNDNYPTETPWGDGNTFVYHGKVHELPTFNSQGVGQMPHVTQQTLYAMPGDIITLAPYYDLPRSPNYKERYSHWYGYNPPDENHNQQPQTYHHLLDSDGNRLLDFLTDPTEIVYTDNAGYFAGTSFPRFMDMYVNNDGVRSYLIYNSRSWNAFATMVNNGQTDLNAIIVRDLDFAEHAIMKIGGYVDGQRIAYRGRFDGNGHTIRNFTLTEDSDGFDAGIFGAVAGGAEILNLKVEGADILSGGRAGVLIGTVYDTEYNDLPVSIHNVIVEGNVAYTKTEDATVDERYYQMARGGGIIGSIEESDNNAIRVNLDKVAFIGNVKGGYGDRTFNAALIGTTNNNQVYITECYAKGCVDNPRRYDDLESQCAVGNRRGMNNIHISNSFIDVATRTADSPGEFRIYQTGFTNVYPADPQAMHISSKSISGAGPIEGTHYIYVRSDWKDMNIYMWREINGYPTLFGAWPGKALTMTADGGYIALSQTEWEQLRDHDDWMFIVNSGSTQTMDCKFPAGEFEYYLFSDVSPIWIKVQPTFQSNRTLKVRNDSGKRRMMVATDRNGTLSLFPDGTLKENNDTETYSIFNIPKNLEDAGFSVYDINENVQLPAIYDPFRTPSGTYRFFVKFDVDWTDFYCELWGGYNDAQGNWVSTAPWTSKGPDGHVLIDGEKYYYYNLPYFSPTSPTGERQKWGVTFSNGQGESYNSVVRQYCCDMILNIKKAGLPYGSDGRKLDGLCDAAIYYPAFYEYSEELPILRIYQQSQEYIASRYEVDGKLYNFVNLALQFNNVSQVSFEDDGNDFRYENTAVVMKDNNKFHFYNNDNWILGKSTRANPAMFYTEYSEDRQYTVYPDERDFYAGVIAEGLGWTEEFNGAPAPEMASVEIAGNFDTEKYPTHDLRWYGTGATFCQPFKTAFAPDADENLSLEKPEYFVAADFGHEFRSGGTEQNMDRDAKVIHEPVINFRHVFHIKDGRKFAEDNTTSQAANENYLLGVSRAVSARADEDFQIRLSLQIPVFTEGVYNQTRTNFYYKKGERLYERVPRVGIEVRDDNGNLVEDQSIFFFDATSDTQGYRRYPAGDGQFTAWGNHLTYHTGNGAGKVYRTIYCHARNAKAGTYVVRLKALNENGEPIKIFGTAYDLYIDQYVVTFLDDQSASVLTESDLAREKYRTHRPEYLEQDEVCGPPAVVVNYDQFKAFENDPYNPADFFRHHGSGAENEYSYRWPVAWDNSTYSFGFGGYYNYDFNEYIIANHSNEVMYHLAANDHFNEDGTKGLYDRLFYDTYDPANPEAAQMGYFYYTNAATDPGVAARLRINNLCPGSTVAVSAWVAEMSYENEVANLCFNFVAVDGDGNREVVHSFITGYIDNLHYSSQNSRQSNVDADRKKTNHGEWMHIYYSFIPDLSMVRNLTMIDHYELELENNCVSSIGADYAVDDIRAYIISPAITAQQLSPVCDANQTQVGIRISSRFDKLLVSNGLEESPTSEDATEITLNFALLDKKIYEELFAKYLSTEFDDDDARVAALNEVVRKSAIRIADSDNEVPDYFIPMKISTYYEGLPEYDQHSLNSASRYTSPTSGMKYFRANLLPTDEDLHPGKDYYIVLYTQYADLPDPEEAGLSIFAVTDDPCAKYAVMTLQGSGTVKIDGIAYTTGEPIDVCIGQSPVVQVDLKMLAEGKELNTDIRTFDDYGTAPTHYYDWFVGSVDEFMTPGADGASPYDLLYIFRNGTTPSGNESGSGIGDTDATELPACAEGEADLYAPLRVLMEQGRLVLHASSFVFPPLEQVEDPDHIRVLTALPILSELDEFEGFKLCSQPSEIRLRVQNSSPAMSDGFFGIDYPGTDVPVRAGLRQLRSLSGLDPLTYPGTAELAVAQTVVAGPDLRQLEIPLRGLCSYKGEDEFAAMTISGNRNVEADPYVYLVETNDPAYISLDKHPMDEVALSNSLLPIGIVSEMNARTDGKMENYAAIVFDRKMRFREGYYYKVRFAFDEIIPTEVEGYCAGHVLFTIKVVPEYLKWTGADSRNWNNDANWSRVTPDDILLSGNDPKREDFTVVAGASRVDLSDDGDGNSRAVLTALPSNRNAYAPLEFTKTVVQKLAADTTFGYPRIVALPEQSISTRYGLQKWSNRAMPEDGDAEMNATPDIEFDMVPLEVDETRLALRPWYANTCEQIHFNHGAELIGQENFIFSKNYQKAWIDMEMTGDRWYTLSSPLQGLVAGDMYTKSLSAKQDTELFTDISFNNVDYGRYEPAVYQRGWNKAEAKTYLLGDASHDSKTAAVALNWSRVYNDVEEDYSPGLGFSIRTVTGNISAPEKDEEGNATVRFRLPKADDSYSYFDNNDNTEDADDTQLNRNGDSRHALTDLSEGSFSVNVSVGTEGRYFLVGNPFIARMKMDRFLDVNSSAIEPAYWIMSYDRQDATLWDEKSGTFITTDLSEQADGLVAPMQGFFVKSRQPASSLGLTFTPDMVETGEISSHRLRIPSAERPRQISVSAMNADGVSVSRAIINLTCGAEADFNASEDLSLLLDHSLGDNPAVYTVASGEALTINTLDHVVETEVGLLAPDGSRTRLRFDGIAADDGLRLLDTATGEISGLCDAMEVEVLGAASGRFYILRTAEEHGPETSMAMVLKERTVTIAAASDGIMARVYTPAGVYAGEWTTPGRLLHFELDRGIFIVEAVADGGSMVRRFIVR